jgi:hypothetical protein
VPAVAPEELSEKGTTGVTCNKASSTNIQTIKSNFKDFNSHRERIVRASIASTKGSAGNIASKDLLQSRF